MKISAIPKSPYKSTNNNKLAANTNANRISMNSNRISTTTTNHSTPRTTTKTKLASQNNYAPAMISKKQRAKSNSSSCSCSESDDDSDSSSECSKSKRVKKSVKHYNSSPNKIDGKSSAGNARKVTAKNALRSDSSDSNTSSDDSSDSESENRSKPTPTYKDTEHRLKKVPPVTITTQQLAADGASSSDMELPNALVQAAILCVESGSEGENTKIEQNNSTQYTSSLLRDFVEKTQMIGSNMSPAKQPLSTSKVEEKANVSPKITTLAAKKAEPAETYSVKATKKRGRPRKQPTVIDDIAVSNKNNSGSPDSGIISNTPQSPVPLSNNNNSSKTNSKKSTNSSAAAKKLDISTLEKSIYATERVLYPPRRKKQESTPQQQQQSIPTESNERMVQNSEKIDPVWRKIDFNKKFRRPSLSGYRSDTNTVCSKVLAAQSGYTSDYCNVNRRHLSGYKSDYSCKSRRSGYKSDYSLKAKSCGYRSDCSTKHRRKIRRKRRTKTASSKPVVNDQLSEILLLASGLSLGQSDSSSDSTDKQQFKSNSTKSSASSRLFSTSDLISSSSPSSTRKPLTTPNAAG